MWYINSYLQSLIFAELSNEAKRVRHTKFGTKRVEEWNLS